MLIVDHHGAVLGVHIHAVDAPAKRPTGILDLELVEGELQVARGKGGKCLGLVGEHALQLRQDLGHLALLHRRERHQRALRTALAGVLGQRLVKDLAQQLLRARQILGRHALHALLRQTGMQMLQHVVDKVALLHVAKARVDGLGLHAIRHKPAQRARRVRLNLRGGRQAWHEQRILALAVTTTQDQVRHGTGTQMLRSFACDTLALEALASRGIKVGDDIALAHARNLDGTSGLGVRSQLGPHGCRIALACLAIMRHAGKCNRTMCRLHRAAKAHAQQGRRFKRHAFATKARRQRGQRPLLVRKRITVQVDIGKQDGIVAAGTQGRRIGKRRKAHLGTRRAVDLVGLVIVGGAALIHLGADAVEHGHSCGLRHVEHASVIHKDVDGMTQQGHLCLTTSLAVKAAQGAVGQRLGNREHGLERRHGFVAP